VCVFCLSQKPYDYITENAKNQWFLIKIFLFLIYFCHDFLFKIHKMRKILTTTKINASQFEMGSVVKTKLYRFCNFLSAIIFLDNLNKHNTDNRNAREHDKVHYRHLPSGRFGACCLYVA